jgi:formyl-CoA transferase
MDSIPTSALEGLRVLDFSQAESGPVCAQWLAWYGAEVVRVDLPLAELPSELLDTPLYLANNMNKRSVLLDYRSDEGRDLLHRMVPRFDVVVENFRLGVAERSGIGYETLRALHPPLIYCTIKGFGLTGPYASYPSLDPAAQAASGAMSMTGFRDGPPTRARYVAADHVTGSVATSAVLAAYVRRLRTGLGEHIELSMQEAMMGMLRSMILIDSPQHQLMGRVGNKMTPPTDLYPCHPGGPNDYVMIVAPGDRFFDRVAITIDRPELLADERFARHEHRVRNGRALWEIVAEWTRQHTKWEAMDAFAGHGVPASAVFDTDDLRTNPHLVEREAKIEVTHPVRGSTEVVNNPVRMDSAVPVRAAPKHGEHTAEVLTAELGLTGDEIDALAHRGVIDLRNVPPHP